MLVLGFSAVTARKTSSVAAGPAWSGSVPGQTAIVARAIPATETRPQVPPLHVDFGPQMISTEPQKPVPDLKTYVVAEGDNPFDLARSLGISEETLLAANGLSADSVLQIGQKLLVPPTSGIVISTQLGDTAPGIADQWKIDLGKLLAFNKLDPKTQALITGSPLVLPGVTPPVQIYPLTDSNADNSEPDSVKASITTQTQQRPSAPLAVTQAPPDTRPAIRRSSTNNFPWGQCTWWAAQSRPDIGSVVVGNASAWLYSARSAGLATGFMPRAGAIVVYQPGAQGAGWTGHVAYVTSVNPDGVTFNISEMNFPIWGGVTHRVSRTGAGVSFIY